MAFLVKKNRAPLAPSRKRKKTVVRRRRKSSLSSSLKRKRNRHPVLRVALHPRLRLYRQKKGMKVLSTRER